MTMRLSPIPLALLGLLATPVGPLQGQASVADAVARLDAANAAAYTDPLTRALGRALPVGFGDRAGAAGPLAFRIGVRGTWIRPGDGTDRFEPVLPGEATWEGAAYADPWVVVDGASSPTATGAGPGAALAPRPGGDFEAALRASGLDPDAVRMELPRGLDLDPVPLTVVEGDIGFGSRTNLAFRLTPTATVVSELGDVSVLGASVSHEFARYLLGDAPPVRLSLAVAYQRLRLGGWMETTATSGSLTVARRLGRLSLHASGALADAAVDVSYRARPEPGVPGFPAEGDRISFSRRPRTEGWLAAGAGLALGRLELSGEWAFAREHAVSVAAFLRLR